jgi:agmatine deiminase
MTGHADGLIRFLDDDTVLVSEIKSLKYYNEGLEAALKKHQLNKVVIPDLWDDLKSTSKSATGNYINYLQIGNLVILPAYGVREDNEVAKYFKKIFPKGTIIETAGASRLSRHGGVFNCISWNVFNS